MEDGGGEGTHLDVAVGGREARVDALAELDVAVPHLEERVGVARRAEVLHACEGFRERGVAQEGRGRQDEGRTLRPTGTSGSRSLVGSSGRPAALRKSLRALPACATRASSQRAGRATSEKRGEGGRTVLLPLVLAEPVEAARVVPARVGRARLVGVVDGLALALALGRGLGRGGGGGALDDLGERLALEAGLDREVVVRLDVVRVVFCRVEDDDVGRGGRGLCELARRGRGRGGGAGRGAGVGAVGGRGRGVGPAVRARAVEGLGGSGRCAEAVGAEERVGREVVRVELVGRQGGEGRGEVGRDRVGGALLLLGRHRVLALGGCTRAGVEVGARRRRRRRATTRLDLVPALPRHARSCCASLCHGPAPAKVSFPPSSSSSAPRATSLTSPPPPPEPPPAPRTPTSPATPPSLTCTTTSSTTSASLEPAKSVRPALLVVLAPSKLTTLPTSLARSPVGLPAKAARPCSFAYRHLGVTRHQERRGHRRRRTRPSSSRRFLFLVDRTAQHRTRTFLDSAEARPLSLSSSHRAHARRALSPRPSRHRPCAVRPARLCRGRRRLPRPAPGPRRQLVPVPRRRARPLALVPRRRRVPAPGRRARDRGRRLGRVVRRGRPRAPAARVRRDDPAAVELGRRDRARRVCAALSERDLVGRRPDGARRPLWRGRRVRAVCAHRLQRHPCVTPLSLSSRARSSTARAR